MINNTSHDPGLMEKEFVTQKQNTLLEKSYPDRDDNNIQTPLL